MIISGWIAANALKLKIALGVVLLLVVTHTAVYFYGKAAQRIENAEERAELWKKETAVAERDGKLNAREAELVGRRAAVLQDKLARELGKLNEAIDKAGSKPECALTPDELRGFQDLARESGR